MEFSAVSDIIWNTNTLHHYFSDLRSKQTESVLCICDDKHLSGYPPTCMFFSSYFSLIVFLLFLLFLCCLSVLLFVTVCVTIEFPVNAHTNACFHPYHTPIPVHTGHPYLYSSSTCTSRYIVPIFTSIDSALRLVAALELTLHFMKSEAK